MTDTLPIPRRPTVLYDAYVFDLDGTVYLGDALLPTAGETITTLRKMGRRTVFLSNNPTHTQQEYATRLERLGLPTPLDDIVKKEGVLNRDRCLGGNSAGEAEFSFGILPVFGHVHDNNPEVFIGEHQRQENGLAGRT